jgi:hypothetical protein
MASQLATYVRIFWLYQHQVWSQRFKKYKGYKLLAILILERKTSCLLSITTADSGIIGFLFTGLRAFYLRGGGGGGLAMPTDRGPYFNPKISDQNWANIGCRSTY